MSDHFRFRRRLLAALDHPRPTPSSPEEIPEDIDLSPGFADRAVERIRELERARDALQQSSAEIGSARPEQPIQEPAEPNPADGWEEELPDTSRGSGESLFDWLRKRWLRPGPLWAVAAVAIAAFVFAVREPGAPGTKTAATATEAVPVWTPPEEIANELFDRWAGQENEFEPDTIDAFNKPDKDLYWDRISLQVRGSIRIGFVLEALAGLPPEDPLYASIAAEWRALRETVSNQQIGAIPLVETAPTGQLREAVRVVLTESSTAKRRTALAQTWTSLRLGLRRIHEVTQRPFAKNVTDSAKWITSRGQMRVLEKHFE